MTATSQYTLCLLVAGLLTLLATLLPGATGEILPEHLFWFSQALNLGISRVVSFCFYILQQRVKSCDKVGVAAELLSQLSCLKAHRRNIFISTPSKNTSQIDYKLFFVFDWYAVYWRCWMNSTAVSPEFAKQWQFPELGQLKNVTNPKNFGIYRITLSSNLMAPDLDPLFNRYPIYKVLSSIKIKSRPHSMAWIAMCIKLPYYFKIAKAENFFPNYSCSLYGYTIILFMISIYCKTITLWMIVGVVLGLFGFAVMGTSVFNLTPVVLRELLGAVWWCSQLSKALHSLHLLT